MSRPRRPHFIRALLAQLRHGQWYHQRRAGYEQQREAEGAGRVRVLFCGMRKKGVGTRLIGSRGGVAGPSLASELHPPPRGTRSIGSLRPSRDAFALQKKTLLAKCLSSKS